ncbi:MAG: biotin--[acetyl-CoA-carboxylase] ligase [Candidatus Aminicenantales bacterium]
MKIEFVIHKVKTCPSTNDLAKKLAEGGAPEGTVVIAEEQTKGKGRKGRAWFSAQKKGLYFSLILRPLQKDISLLPLVAGIATREAVKNTCGLSPKLLWPNDIIWRKKKLGGILCESGVLGDRTLYAVVGIGLNVSHEKSEFPEEIEASATSLKLASQKPIDEEGLVRNICRALDLWYNAYVRGESEKIIRNFEQSSVIRRGGQVTVLREDLHFSGYFAGIAPDGALILEEGGRPHYFHSAEIIKIECP